MIDFISRVVVQSPFEALAAVTVLVVIVSAVAIGRRQARALWRESEEHSWLTALMTFDPTVIRDQFAGHDHR